MISDKQYWRLMKLLNAGKTLERAAAFVWSEIVPFLESEPEVEATTLLEYLSGRYPNRFSDSHLRTLQRRVNQWRAVYGSPKEVFFEQRHLPGHQAQSDFTSFNELNITINR